MKIAVCGSGGQPKDGQEMFERLGTVLGERGHEVLVGAGAQVPYLVASSAHRAGSVITGYSPWAPESAQELGRIDAHGVMQKMITLPEALANISSPVRVKMRNMMLVGDSDAAVVVGGSWGTMTEVGMARSMDLPVGAYKGTGGVANAMRAFMRYIEHTADPKYFIESADPLELITALERFHAERMRLPTFDEE